MEKKEKPIYYGILMNRKTIDVGIYLFHPEYLIEGEVIEEDEEVHFIDKLGNDYLTINDIGILAYDEEVAVGYIISEEELMGHYENLDLDEVKRSYFDNICSNIHIGFYIMDAEVIGVVPFDFASMSMQLNNAKIDPNSAVVQMPIDNIYPIQMPNQETLDQLISNFGGQDVIAISMDEFEKILKIQDPNKMKEALETIYKNVEEVNSHFLEQEKEMTKKEDIKETLSEEEIEQEEIINVREMKEFFDERIIGQDEAKKDVISAIVMNKLSDNSTDRNSCLLVGPTGSGKTLIAETVSKYFDMPMVVIDTTQLTVPGYKGADIEDFLARLLSKAGGLQKAQEGIVVFDEIDKKGSEKNDDVSGKGVLNTLLSFLQGTVYDVTYNNRVFHFDTSKLTVFATGAFTDVAQNRNSNSYNDTKMGFNSDLGSRGEQDIKYRKLEINDFVKYGNMPVELMGRFTTIAQLTGHTKESLRQILTESNISALLAEKQKLEKIQVELTWTDGYLDAVADKAFELKTGARSLKNTVELSVKEARWEVLNNLDTYKAIILTEKTVQDNFDCTLVDINGNNYNLKDIIASKEKQKTLKK